MIPFSVNQEVCNNRSGIYAIVNLKTEKFYIGSAVKLNSRKSLHLHNLRKGLHHSKYLQRSYNKHGEEVFVFKVLEYVEDENNLLKVEQKYLDIYFHTGITYNICGIAGSQLGIKRSDETKKKMSFAKQNMSNETKKKIFKPVVQLDKNNNFVERFNSIAEVEIKLGIFGTHISACCLGKHKSAGNYLWMYETDYLNGKRYEENTLISGYSKPIIQLTKNNELVKKYNSITEAKRETGISNGSINQCCLGKRKSAGKYLWIYEDDYLNGKRPEINNLINGNSKPIIQFTKQNEFVKKYNSITEASRETEIKRGSISQCCLGNLKSAGGYIWRYELS